MEQLEVFPGDRVLITLTQETHVVGALEIVQAHRVASKALEVAADGARILHSPVDQFLFAIATQFQLDCGNRGGQGNHHQSRDHHQADKNVTALRRAAEPTTPEF